MPLVSMTSSSDSVTGIVADAYVVDTGVFLRWFVDQDGFEHARELQTSGSGAPLKGPPKSTFFKGSRSLIRPNSWRQPAAGQAKYRTVAGRVAS
jgi:hypothetical protein